MAQRTYEDMLTESLSGSPTSQEPMSGGNEAAHPFTQDYYQNAPSTGNSGVSGYGYGGTTPPPVVPAGGVTTQPVPVPASGGSPYGGGDRASTIAGWYRQYLGRHDPNESGYQGWVNGNMSLPQIEATIRNSPEARAYAAAHPTGGASAPTSGSGGPGFNSNRLDDNVINAYIARWADLPGADPSLKSDPAYWAARIKEKGGLGADNESYWQWMALNNYKQTPHGGGEFNDQWGGQLESLVNQYLGNTRERAAALAAQYRARAKELNQPAYTTAEDQAIRARAFDQLERRRAETSKNQRERVYARGFAPTSGLAQGAEQEVNRNFEQVRGGIESDLTQSAINETQRRRDVAMQLEALATEALNGGDLSAIQATGLPLQLMDTRQTQALNTFNSSGNPLSSLMAIIAAGQGQQQGQNAQNANTASGLGSLLPLILQYLR